MFQLFFNIVFLLHKKKQTFQNSFSLLSSISMFWTISICWLLKVDVHTVHKTLKIFYLVIFKNYTRWQNVKLNKMTVDEIFSICRICLEEGCSKKLIHPCQCKGRFTILRLRIRRWYGLSPVFWNVYDFRICWWRAR